MNEFNFEAKRKIVEAGASKVFKEWSAHSSITMDDFIRELEWVCSDPADGGPSKDKMTREIALTPTGIKRLGRNNGFLTAFYELDTGLHWDGEFFEFPVTTDKERRIHGDVATYKYRCKISLSAKDRV